MGERLAVVRELAGWRREGGELVLRGRGDGDLEVEVRAAPVAPWGWRLRLGPAEWPASPLLVWQTLPAPPWRLEEDADFIYAVTEGLTLRAAKGAWCLAWLDPAGRVVCREAPDDVTVLREPNARPLGLVRGEDGAVRAVCESFRLGLQERLYGLGEQFLPLERRGQRHDLWVRDALCTTTGRAYKPVPLLLSSAGYGLFVHTTRRIDCDLGATAALSWSLRVDGPALDLFVIHGPGLPAILERYTGLTGRPAVPPPWAFGLWLSSCGCHRTQAAMEGLARGLRERGIPGDVIHIDPWWMRPRRYADLVWDRRAFPDPEGLVARLEELGLKLTLYEHPYLSRESELFREAEAKGFLVKDAGGRALVIDYGLSRAARPGEEAAAPGETWNAPVGLIDFTDAAALRWWQELHRPLLAMGVKAFKTDFGEDVPEEARFANGLSGAAVHNAYPLLYNQAVWEVTAEETGQGLVWGRSGWAGSQRWPACWGGDPQATFESLACALRGALSLSLSGVPFWSHDIGGYWGEPDEELYVRWAQVGLLSPLSRCHGEGRREPWAFGPRAEAIFREYAKLRYRLLPYLYATALAAGRTGMPVARPLVLHWPDDPVAARVEDQFLLGEFLLVAPVLERAQRRRLYLPEGLWIDHWTGEALPGPAWVERAAPLEVLPLYIRGGAIIPLGPPADRVPAGPGPVVFQVHPCGESAFLHLDGREEVALRCREEEGGVVFTAGPSAYPLAAYFHRIPRPGRVLLGGGELPPAGARLEPGTWRWVGEPGHLQALLPPALGERVLTVGGRG